jgi:hypothetical protein
MLDSAPFDHERDVASIDVMLERSQSHAQQPRGLGGGQQLFGFHNAVLRDI